MASHLVDNHNIHEGPSRFQLPGLKSAAAQITARSLRSEALNKPRRTSVSPWLRSAERLDQGLNGIQKPRMKEVSRLNRE
jgi:hypothetical protein